MPELVVSEYLLPGDPRQRGADDIHVCRAPQRDGRVLWAVRRTGDCLNKHGQWESEPSPSGRSDAFLARCRFDSVQEAARAAGATLTAHARGQVTELPGEPCEGASGADWQRAGILRQDSEGRLEAAFCSPLLERVASLGIALDLYIKANAGARPAGKESST